MYLSLSGYKEVINKAHSKDFRVTRKMCSIFFFTLHNKSVSSCRQYSSVYKY